MLKAPKILVYACHLLAILNWSGFPLNGAVTVTLFWDYDLTAAMICAVPQQNSCLDHFEIGTFNGTIPVFVTAGIVPIGLQSGIVTNIQGSFSFANPPFGRSVFAVIVVGRDASGIRITSDPNLANISFTFGPAAPTNLKITVK